MIKHYGGIPLIEDRVYTENDKIDVPRSTYGESVKYAVDQCDSAFYYLERSGHIYSQGTVNPVGSIREKRRACMRYGGSGFEGAYSSVCGKSVSEL